MNNILQEIAQAKNTIFNVKKEIKTLKKRVAAYKGWTKRYRNQQKDLRKENKELQNEITGLSNQLANQVKLGIQAKNQRDNTLKELNELISRIESFKITCEQYNKMNYANKSDLIREAENLLFDEEIEENQEYIPDSMNSPQLYTDPASNNRSLLDR